MKTLTRLLNQYDRTSKGLGFKTDGAAESDGLARLTKITSTDQLTTGSFQGAHAVIIDNLDNLSDSDLTDSSLLVGYDAREIQTLPSFAQESPISFAIIDLATALTSLQFHHDFSIVLAIDQSELSDDLEHLYSILRGRQALPLAAILLNDKTADELRDAKSILTVRSLSDTTSLPLIVDSEGSQPSQEELIDLKALGVRALLV